MSEDFATVRLEPKEVGRPLQAWAHPPSACTKSSQRRGRQEERGACIYSADACKHPSFVFAPHQNVLCHAALGAHTQQAGDADHRHPGLSHRVVAPRSLKRLTAATDFFVSRRISAVHLVTVLYVVLSPRAQTITNRHRPDN